MMETKCKTCQFSGFDGECQLPSYYIGVPHICENPKGDELYQKIKETIANFEIWEYLSKYRGCCFDHQDKVVIINYVRTTLKKPIDNLPIDIAIAELTTKANFNMDIKLTGEKARELNLKSKGVEETP